MNTLSNEQAVLQVKDLCIAFPTQGGGRKEVVSSASFSLDHGEVLAIVGESGSGKTMMAKALLGLLPGNGFVSGGSLSFEGRELSQFTNDQWQTLRGQKISMIFQEPMVSLNPTLKIGFQLCEAMRYHTQASEENIKKRAIELLTRIKIRDPESCLEKYPHEFSGGMRQRIMIASSLMMRPQLLVADEPTTALDCLVQKEVLDILLEMAKAEGTALLLITHDLGLVAHYADKVLVMEKGIAVERGEVSTVLENPLHPYTRKLLASLPHKIERPDIIEARENIVSLKNVSVDYPIRRPWFWQQQQFTRVLEDINLTVKKGETLAIVGESGSGKTTLGRAILQLTEVSEGTITVKDITVTGDKPPGFRAMSKVVQLVFQDPFAALSPRQTIGKIIAEPLRLTNTLSKYDIEKQTLQMLEDVGLPIHFASRYPNELSGGQRQRVSIARALINKPELIIADEPVSALDITVQAQVLTLLDKLKEKHGFSCIFISHDLAVVEQIADRVVVLYHGKIVESGLARELFSRPAHRYTRRLLEALPELRARNEHSYQLYKRQHTDFMFPAGYTDDDSASGTRCFYQLSDQHQVACQKELV